MDDLLKDFFKKVDEVDAKEKKAAAKKLKRYRPADDNPIKAEPNEPLYVALYWTKITCRCGYTCSKPTYPGLSAFVYHPNQLKKGVAELIPLFTFDAFTHLPHKEIWTDEHVSLCPECFPTLARQQGLLFPPDLPQIPKELQKKHHELFYHERGEEDIRMHLDDPEVLALEEILG